MNQLTIETHDLDFHFKDFQALRQINLSVPQGSIFGFLGPNGAGKTTTIRILLDLFHPTTGRVNIFGKDLLRNRIEILKKVGALIENPSIYKHLTGRQNLEVVRRMIDVPKARIDEVLKIVRLVDNADKKAKNYSLGMCQRLGLAAALLTDPELLILDEPTNGLDPSGIIEMRELIIKLNKEHGKTIFISSHILPEIEKLATDLAIIDQGEIRYQGQLDGLRAHKKQVLNIRLDHVTKASDILSSKGYQVYEQTNDSISLQRQSKSEIAAINRILVESGLGVYEIRSSDEDLESIFLNLTKKLDQ